MAQDEDLPPPKADFSAPPPYELVSSQPQNGQSHQIAAENLSVQLPVNNNNNFNIPNDDEDRATTTSQQQQQRQHVVDMSTDGGEVAVVEPTPQLPSKLPTYEEVQMEKSRLGEIPMHMPHNTFPSVHGRIPPPSHPVLISALRNSHAQGGAPPGSVAVGPNGTLTFISIESGDSQGRHHHHHHHASSAASSGAAGAGGAGATAINVDNSLLGTDFMFLAAFIVAFLFNWIGFLMLTCFFHTIAARYGALSGFGLSLAKWTLIVKKTTDMANHDSSWLWWLIMSFGCLICVRALVQYVSIKRTWRMMSASAQERLLFFY